MADFTVTAIGHVHNQRTAPEDDDWDSVVSTIALDDQWFTPDVVAGLTLTVLGLDAIDATPVLDISRT